VSYGVRAKKQHLPQPFRKRQARERPRKWRSALIYHREKDESEITLRRPGRKKKERERERDREKTSVKLTAGWSFAGGSEG